SDDEKSTRVRDAYAGHVQNMFALLGDAADKAAAEAKVVLSVETKLAQVSLTRVQRREPEAVYHKMTVAQLAELTPNFSWPAYLKEINHPENIAYNVDNPSIFKEVNKDLTDVSLADWKTYLRWHLIDVAAPYLSSKFEGEDFNFEKVLTGTQEMLPRWKRVVRTTDRSL